MHASAIDTPPRPGLPARAALAILPVLATAVVGTLATVPNIPGWYEGLAKPPGTPPNGVFSPVWTILYAVLAVVAWRLLSAPPSPARRRALVAFWVQLGLNALWSWLFFAARSPAMGLAEIAVLLVALAVAIRTAAEVDRPAALLMVPYALWVGFASYLTAGIWWLNG